MSLTKDGSLWRLAVAEEQLVLTLTAADGTVTASAVPQTQGVGASHLQVGIDEVSGTVITVWQTSATADARVFLATFNAGTWQGPELIAGATGLSAANPTLLVRRVTTVFEEETGPVAYTDTLAHLSWWEGLETPEHGNAVYASLPVEDDGSFDIGFMGPIALSRLVPYGLACVDVPDASNIAQPHLVLDPASGEPRAVAVDLSNCLFYSVELRPVLGDPDAVTKRRRNTIIFGFAGLMPVNPMVPLTDAKMEVGRDLTVVLYWDVEAAVRYARLNTETWSPVRPLPIGGDVTRERAVELIRGLAW